MGSKSAKELSEEKAASFQRFPRTLQKTFQRVLLKNEEAVVFGVSIINEAN